MNFDDFTSFGDMLGMDVSESERFDFANEVRSRILSARRRLASFSRGIIERELHDGRCVAPGGPIIFGASGLYSLRLPHDAAPQERSRRALSLLLTAQRYGLPVAPSEMQGTFLNAGDWMVQVPEVGMLFQEVRGSLANAFEFLSKVDGAVARPFPGYGKFETSLDERVMTEGEFMRGPLERQKMRALEEFVELGRERNKEGVTSSTQVANTDETLRVALVTTVLDSDHLTAIKLALKTKRLPLSPSDENESGEADQRLPDGTVSGFSGIPLADYYIGWEESCGFSKITLEVTRFLVTNRRVLKDLSRAGMSSEKEVQSLANLCGDIQRLRALFVFTCADRSKWESAATHPSRWFLTRELYHKTVQVFQPSAGSDHAQEWRHQGLGDEEFAILGGFGPALLGGTYRHHAARFGSHLLRILGEGKQAAPKAALLQDVTSTMLGVAAWDWPGLAACISGELWQRGIELQQAHLFSASKQGLALDFFHLHTGGTPLPRELTKSVEQAILQRSHLAPEDAAALPVTDGTCTLTEVRPGQCCLRFESLHDTPGTIYALCYKIFRHLQGNIHGLTAYRTRRSSIITIYCQLPSGGCFKVAKASAEQWR